MFVDRFAERFDGEGVSKSRIGETLVEAEQALQATQNDPANIKSVVVPK